MIKYKMQLKCTLSSSLHVQFRLRPLEASWHLILKCGKYGAVCRVYSIQNIKVVDYQKGKYYF